MTRNPYQEENRPPGSVRVARYVDDVLEGRQLAGKEVVDACRRHKRDLARGWWKFDKATADKVVRFAELLPNATGQYTDADTMPRMVLLDWQCFYLGSIFAWRNPRTGLRRFKQAYLSVARKNGKTLMAVVAGLYAFVMEKHIGGRFYSAASSQEQAGISWDLAYEILGMTPELMNFAGVKIPQSNARLGVIRRPEINAKWGCLPKEVRPGSLDGKNATFVLADEVHTWAGNAQATIQALEMAQLGQKEPMFLCVTTSGVGLGEWWHDMETKYLKNMVEDRASNPRGIVEDNADDDPTLLDEEDDRVFYLGYHVDEKTDVNDRDVVDSAAWAKANPGLDVVHTAKQLRAELKRAEERPMELAEKNVKRLNRWLTGATSWFDMEKFKKLSVPSDANTYEGFDCYIGLAPTYSCGVAAMAFMFKKPGDDVWRLRVEYWIPDNRFNPNAREYKATALPLGLNKMKTADGVRPNYVHIVPASNVVPFVLLAERVAVARKTHNVVAVGYERSATADAVDADMERMASEGVKVVRQMHNTTDSGGPIQQFANLVASEQVRWEDNTLFETQLRLTGLKGDARGDKHMIVPAQNMRPYNATTGPRAVVYALGSTRASIKKPKGPKMTTFGWA